MIPTPDRIGVELVGVRGQVFASEEFGSDSTRAEKYIRGLKSVEIDF